MAAQAQKTSSVDSRFPCFLPEDELLTINGDDFKQKMQTDLKTSQSEQNTLDAATGVAKMDLDTEASATEVSTSEISDTLQELAKDNKILTDNGDVTFKSTLSPLLDLFDELGRDIAGPRLEELLNSAWKVDSLTALKIVWNARSIHLGKGEQDCFYKAMGWLAKNHPSTFLRNLQWLIRPVIELKPVNAKDKPVMVEEESAVLAETPQDMELLHGGAHGYFKDLLNLVVLAAHGALDVNDNPHKILHAANPHTKKRRCPFPAIPEGKRVGGGEPQSREERVLMAKNARHQREDERAQKAISNLKKPFNRYLHATVARIFAQELTVDLKRLKSGKKSQVEKVTLAAKWAPSLQGFHDKHTLIATSIAEILFPSSFFDPQQDRTTYLKLAREAYRSQYLTPLRAHLDVVERKISRQMFGEIDYAKVPSLAMNMYKQLFVDKDYDHFATYIQDVAEGKANISGAIMTPAVLVYNIMHNLAEDIHHANQGKTMQQIFNMKQQQILASVSDMQWTTLVDRLKKSGRLLDTVAVCDVSGSMYSPTFNDGTAPIHTAIGLSLLVAELSNTAFRDQVITFSQNPKMVRIPPVKKLSIRVQDLVKLDWGMNTDFVAVFEKVILPTAIKTKTKPAQMVKQVIVFSDMQFDAAELTRTKSKLKSWESSFERIKGLFAASGYELPTLVFWNLASRADGNTAAKPVTKNEFNTVMVSGYSQAMLKMFTDEGGFDSEIEEESEADDEELVEIGIEDATDAEQTAATEKKEKKKKVKKIADPEAGMRKAIGHPAYRMLKVYD